MQFRSSLKGAVFGVWLKTGLSVLQVKGLGQVKFQTSPALDVPDSVLAKHKQCFRTGKIHKHGN